MGKTFRKKASSSEDGDRDPKIDEQDVGEPIQCANCGFWTVASDFQDGFCSNCPASKSAEEEDGSPMQVQGQEVDCS